MLKVARIAQARQKAVLLKDFDPDRDLWVVSDLRSKLELQKVLMRSRAGMPADCLLRSSELWAQLLKVYSPQSLVLSRDWMELFARTALGAKLDPADINLSVELLGLFAPVFYHEDAAEIIQDLLAQDASAELRWGRIVVYAKFLFDQAGQHGWVIQDWLPAALTEFQDLSLKVKGQIIFDLGASLGSSEAELIRRLAQNHDVLVILPRPANWKKNEFLLQPGESLLGLATEVSLDPVTVNPDRAQIFKRFSGRTAEIKNAVSQVREWLDEGIAPENIGVITPNFEKDFPILEEYFRVEGVALDRQSPERRQTHRTLQKWSARLRLWKEDLEYQDLVAGFPDRLPLRSEEFASRFQSGLFHSDLARDEAVKNEVESWRWDPNETELSGFFKQASKLWQEGETADLEAIFETMNERTPSGVSLSTRDWIGWMEVQLSRLEVSSAVGGQGRLSIAPLQSCESFQWTHRIFLSLVDPLPERKTTMLLNMEEIQKLGGTYGFYLPHPEQKFLQFELEWAARSTINEDHFSYPMSDWQGQPTSPQPFWLAGKAEVSHQAEMPGTTRWDEIQASKVHHDDTPRAELLTHPEDLLPPFGQSSERAGLKLSLSSLQRFGECPFIYASEKLLGLIDAPLLDLELDRRTTGSLQHAFLEKLMESPVQWERTRDEMSLLLDQIKESKPEIQINDLFWSVQKQKWIEMGLRFLKAEKAWFEQFPNSRIIGREHSFSFVFESSTKTWRRGEATLPTDILFRGLIDRIDGAYEGSELVGIVIYDYKSSVHTKHGFSKWLSENEIQLAFYSWAANEGLIDPSWKGKLAGAAYYNLKNLERSTGFFLPDYVGQLFPEVRPKNFDADQLGAMWGQLKHLVESRILKIQEGHFTPKPAKLENCDRCHWKGLCRAPHLT